MKTLLNTRTCYSLLNSTIRLDQLIEYAKNNGLTNLAICDDELYGAINFSKACRVAGLNPIIGQRRSLLKNDKTYQLAVYPINDNGLVALQSVAPGPLSFTDLLTLSRNCYLISDQPEFFEDRANRLPHAYIVYHQNNSDYDYLKYVPAVYAPDSQFAAAADYEDYRVLCAIGQQKTFDDASLVCSDSTHCLPGSSALNGHTAEGPLPSAVINNTDWLGSSINVTPELLHTSLPEFITPDHSQPAAYLRKLCQQGLQDKLPDTSEATLQKYNARLDYELNIINKMGFASYFLIINDVIAWARQNDVYVGLGRGSSVGSLVAYSLGITQPDPIANNLLFERFLNPERITMPDIDIDIPDDCRDKVIEYVRERYGEDKVGHIITFNTLAAKAVLRDAGKAMGVDPAVVASLSSAVPNRPKITLAEALNESAAMKAAVNSNPQAKELLTVAQRLEGLPRNTSIHAGGIVVASDALNNVIPTINVNDFRTTEYTMEHLEALGLIKIDFLGLKNLRYVRDVYRMIDPDMSVADIMRAFPAYDKESYDLLCAGDTSGIFQLESPGITQALVKLHPTSFADLTALIALYRPGPISFIGEFIHNKKYPAAIKYLHPDLKPILKDTYGIIVYQEQIMQIAQKIAGFSLGKADILRKAISKKQTQKMAELRAEFIGGALAKGYAKDVAVNCYDIIQRFANYGFNKSHAVAYTLLSAQTAYLKAHYPVEFYTSLLNGALGDTAKVAAYEKECQKRGITLLPADLNHSVSSYVLENGCIRQPLSQNKGISSSLAETLIRQRQQQGEYQDYLDFFKRIFIINRNKKTIENCIDSGLLDIFGNTREAMKNAIGEFAKYTSSCRVKNGDEITYDFSLVPAPFALAKESGNIDPCL